MKKIALEISDFTNLNSISREITELLWKIYPNQNQSLEEILNQDFPLRWKVEVSNTGFEWVISEMGSITLRLGDNSPSRRNPPPIFYLSIGKYEPNIFLWETPEGNPIENLLELLPKLVLEKINLYLESEKSI